METLVYEHKVDTDLQRSVSSCYNTSVFGTPYIVTFPTRSSVTFDNHIIVDDTIFHSEWTQELHREFMKKSRNTLNMLKVDNDFISDKL
jgi:hypothetical protein